MANIEALIERRSQEREARLETNRQNRAGLSETRNSMIETVTSEPQRYLEYLELQAKNPRCSMGNVVLSMLALGNRNPSILGTAEQWRAQGRHVLEEEKANGAPVFVPAKRGQGYFMGEYFDISQTGGRPLKEPMKLEKDDPATEKALSALMDTAPVKITSDPTLGVPARYDMEKLEIAINTKFSDVEIFAALADEVAYAKYHNHGYNESFSKAEYQLDAESAGYMLCKRFGIEHKEPDVSNLKMLYGGYDTETKGKMLDAVHRMTQDIGNSIEQKVMPRQRENMRGTRVTPYSR